MAHLTSKTRVFRKFKVELWVNTVGVTPAARLTKMVEAETKNDAVDAAICLAKVENPEVDVLQVDTWFVERLYSLNA